MYGYVYKYIEKWVLSNILTYFPRLCTFLDPVFAGREWFPFFVDYLFSHSRAAKVNQQGDKGAGKG